MGMYDSSMMLGKRYRRGWPKAKRAGSRGGTKSGVELQAGLRLIVSLRLCDRLAVIAQERHYFTAKQATLHFRPQHGHQVGSTLYLTISARANALARYLILLSRQGKVVSPAAGVLATSRS